MCSDVIDIIMIVIIVIMIIFFNIYFITRIAVKHIFTPALHCLSTDKDLCILVHSF